MADDSLDEGGTLQFLPSNLNRQPVVMGGLTADEMWTTLIVSGVAGLLLGIPLAIVLGNPALVIAGGLAGGAFGLLIASRILRRLKRGRPDTWFYRRVQLLAALHVPFPIPFVSNPRLVIRSGAWTCRRSE